MMTGLVLSLFCSGTCAVAEPSMPKRGKPFLLRGFLVGAHRGGMGLWPESTLEAFDNAASRWPDALIESDARLTSDGQVVLLHDDTLDRTTNGSGAVADKTLAEIQGLDAGYRLTFDEDKTFPYRGKGITVPTLTAALEALPHKRFLIELKNQPGVVEAVVRAIEAAEAQDRTAFASFNPMLMHRARELAPWAVFCYDLPQGMNMLKELRSGDWNHYTAEAEMLAISDDLVDKFGITAEDFHAIRGKGIFVLVHTINSPEAMRRFLDMGVDCVLTDYPDRLSELIAQPRERR